MGDDEFLDSFHEHLDRLHNLARGLTRNAQDAADLVPARPACSPCVAGDGSAPTTRPRQLVRQAASAVGVL